MTTGHWLNLVYELDLRAKSLGLAIADHDAAVADAVRYHAAVVEATRLRDAARTALLRAIEAAIMPPPYRQLDIRLGDA